MRLSTPRGRAYALATTLLALNLLVAADRAAAQLFENLEAFDSRLPLAGGPKGIAAADLDGDGALDLAVSDVSGRVTLFFGGADGEFAEPLAVDTGTSSLRELIIADLTADGLPDVAAGAVWNEAVVILENRGGREFAEPRELAAPGEIGGARVECDSERWWECPLPGFFSRNLAAGDFDGDGLTDLVVGGSGVGVREFRGAAAGELVPVGGVRDLDAGGSSKPVYSLRALRPAGAAADSLVATHAWSDRAWILSQGPEGRLQATGMVPGIVGAYYLEVGRIASPADAGLPDLVSVHRNLGTIEIRRGVDSPNRFAGALHQQIHVPGGPRAVRIVDLDDDGWNDLVVVVRNLDRVLTYRNDRGVLVPGSEMPVGESPRDVAVGDFSGDGELDLAVINRWSFDISVLPGRPGEVGFSVLDQTYLLDGEVVALEVLDLDGNGRDDIVQLHRMSGDMSVWISGEGGRLEMPIFYPMGVRPTALQLKDISGDGILDAVTANLGIDSGAIGVRLGRADGTFGQLVTIAMPDGSAGRLFSLRVADFDGDDIPDAAAGFLDCRLALMKGNADGSFTLTNVHRFILEARAMAVGDFDQDGDIDIAGGSFTGDIVVVENRGNLLSTPVLDRTDYRSPTEGKFGTRDMEAEDVTGDGDLDLVIASGHGVMVYRGTEGMGFVLESLTLDGTDFPCSSVVTTDLDGDGNPDIAVSCEIFACIIILTKVGDRFRPAVVIDVPDGKLLATGDLDGDGHTDLVGSGEALWTALSGRRAEPGAAPVVRDSRQRIDGVVINEVLAINNAVPLPDDGDRTPDWVELYNGTAGVVSLGGWKLTAVVPGGPGEPQEVREFALPEGAFIASGAHLVVVHSKNQRSPLHTGFKLPGSGARLELRDAGGAIVDRVDYPAQFENVSFSRFKDGLLSFTFNPFPNAGLSNLDNGTVAPLAKFESVGFPFEPGKPVQFHASVDDDLGVVSTSVLYRWTNGPDAGIHRVVLFDDGLHGDGDVLDGSFAGTLDVPLPAGAELEFYVEVEDLSGNVVQVPDGVALDGSGESAGDGIAPYRVRVGRTTPRPPLEISEVVSLNNNGLTDEAGGTPDWVEVRNCSSEPVSLDGIALGNAYPDPGDYYAFPGGQIAPGGTVIVFCDSNPGQGPAHAPFTLKASGERVVLLELATGEIVDAVDYPALPADTAWARGGCGGGWRLATPTPGSAGPGTARIGDVNASGGVNITDAIAVLNHLFGAKPIACVKAADANGDGGVDLSDAVRILNFLFLGGPELPPGEVTCE